MQNHSTPFGQWLRQRRRSLDFTQVELAYRVGCSVVNIRKIEAGERRPSRQIVQLLANQLGIASDERIAFLQFARTGMGAAAFRHPLLAETTVPVAEERYPEETALPADVPQWIESHYPEIPLSLREKVMVCSLQTAAVAPGTSEILPDSRMLCKLQSAGKLWGDLSGWLRQEITELSRKIGDENDNFSPVTTLFTIETADGVVKGYYTGFFTEAEDGTHAKVQQHGQVTSVTPAYVDLFMANVFYRGEVPLVNQEGVADRGTITIAPR
jgi:transcriptional regulator with XRE-family HTH domain